VVILIYNNRTIQKYGIGSAGISLGFGVLTGALFPITVPLYSGVIIYDYLKNQGDNT